MKRTIIIAILSGGLCSTSFAQLWFSVEAPQDDGKARRSVLERPELRSLETEFSEIIQTRLLPRTADEIQKIFGPLIGTSTNWWTELLDASGRNTNDAPKLAQYPADLVLPLFVSTRRSEAGAHNPDPARNKNHTDLHALGSLGYVEFYYSIDGNRLEDAILYFRADEKFVALKSTNYFAGRLEWEKAKLDAVKVWLAAQMPKINDLGTVELTESGPRRVDLGAEVTGNFTIMLVGSSRESNRLVKILYVFEVEKVTVDTHERISSRRDETFRPGQSVGFSMDGKFYQLTPKIVE